MTSSSDILLKAVLERELQHINLMRDGLIRSEYTKDNLLLVSEYIESRINTLS